MTDRLMTALDTILKYRWFAGAVATTFAAFVWVAAGGLAPMVAAIGSLNDQAVAEAIVALPDFNARLDAIDARLEDIGRHLDEQRAQWATAQARLDRIEASSTVVVEWDVAGSQELTDQAGGCYPGEPCTAYMRGRRTPAGARCEIIRGAPVLVVGTGEEFPIRWSGTGDMIDLPQEWRTIALDVEIPAFVRPGVVGFLVMTVYKRCPFAPEGGEVHRSTFTLSLTVHPTENRPRP